MPNRFLEKLAYWFDTASRSEDLIASSKNSPIGLTQLVARKT